jgi:hypothetical protein
VSPHSVHGVGNRPFGRIRVVAEVVARVAVTWVVEIGHEGFECTNVEADAGRGR